MDDDGPVVGRERPQSSIDGVAGDELAARVGGRPVVVRQQADVGFVASASPRFVAAGVDEQATQPGIQAVGVTQRSEVPPRAHQRLLHRVLRATAIAHDQAGGRKQLVEPRCRERRERVAVSASCFPNQGVVLHRASLERTTLAALLHGMAHARPDRFIRPVG